MTINTPATSLARPDSAAPPELSIIVPTYNEAKNLPILIERIARAMPRLNWEVIVVDDNSPDGTNAVARRLGESDSRIRCIRRVGRRGLAGACIEGMLASSARYVAVMDADLQHDETLLPGMLSPLQAGSADLVVASRFCEGAQEAGLSAGRARASRFSNAFARRFLGVDLTDPLSGFFMIRRDLFDEIAPALSTQGFKILLDIAATARGKLRISELPFTFGKRLHGDSKLDAQVVLDFAQLVLAKLTNDAVSFRFVLFCLVGLSGVGIHMSVLALLREYIRMGFSTDQTIATLVAIVWNFVLNNAFTYRDQRLPGWRFIAGLFGFGLICAIGAVSNIGIAKLLYGQNEAWWVAGLAGALTSAVWNYTVSAAFIWRSR